jgi:hypothetical protein
VLVEIEKDEMYEARHRAADEDGTNHMEFITWDEFESYFTNYKELDERFRRKDQVQAIRADVQ